MADISKFLNLAEAVKSGNRYVAGPVSDAELTELIAEAHVEIGFALGAQNQVEGAVNKAIIEGIASGAEYEEFMIKEAFAPTGFLKKVIDFFVGLWRKLVAFVKGIVGNLFASGSKMREKISYIIEVGERCKGRNYANTTTVKYKNYVATGLEQAMNIGAVMLVAENYYTQPMEEGKENLTFDKLNNQLENLGREFLETYSKTDTYSKDNVNKAGQTTSTQDTDSHKYYTGKQQSAADETAATAKVASIRTGHEATLGDFKDLERKLGEGEKGSIEILRTILKAKLGKEKSEFKKIVDEVKENDSIKKFTNALKDKLFPTDWKEVPAEGKAGITQLCGILTSVGNTAKSSNLDSLLTKEVEALDTKAKRMESLGKQLESGAKLSNASVSYGSEGKVVDGEKDAGKNITEIAQLAQKIGSAFSAAINAGLSVATGLYMESVNEAYAVASAVDKAPVIQ